MKRNLLGNLSFKNSSIFVGNGCKKQGTCMVGLLLMVVLMAWTEQALAQTTPVVADGIYYAHKGSGSSAWYLWPSVSYDDDNTNYGTNTGNHFVTTYQGTSAPAYTGQNYPYEAHDNTYPRWVVKNLGDDIVQIINPKTNKYIIIRGPHKDCRSPYNTITFGDRDIWLADLTTENTNSSKFKLISGVNITVPDTYGSGSGYGFNTAAGDKNYISATSASTPVKTERNYRNSLIQLVSSGQNYTFTPALLTEPTISAVDPSTGRVTVTDVNGLPSGYNIRYTVSTDGTAPADPTATSSPMDPEGYLVTEECIIKAVVERYGVVLTSVATSGTLVPAILAAPTVTDNCDNTFELSCSNSAAAVIYYNLSIDGTEPDVPDATSTQYHEGSPVSFGLNYYLKAISIVDGTVSSEVTPHQFTQVYTEAPTITLSATTATLTAATGATIYYTTDGSEPTTSSSTYSVPVTISETSDVDIRAIAQSSGELASCVARVSRPAEPTLTVTDGDCTTTTADNLVTLTAPADGRTLWYTYTAGNNSTAPDPTTTSYIQYNEPVSLSDLDGSNAYYTIHAYAQSSDGLYQSPIVSVSHQMKTTGTPELTAPTGSNPVVVISGGVFGDVAVCIVGGNTTNVDIESDGTAEYTIPSGVSGTLTVTFKHGNWLPSCEATYTIPTPPETPTWSQTCDNLLSLSTTSSMAIIHYTIDGTEALATSPTYTEGCLYNITPGTSVRAKAFDGFLSSGELDYTYQPEHVAVPQFFVNGTEVTISGPSGTTIRYTSSVGTTPGVVPSDPADPTSSSTPVNEPIIIAGNNIITVFKAIAIPSDPDQASCVVRVVTREGYSISSESDLTKLTNPDNSDKYFFLFADIDFSDYTGPVDNFTGVLDGNYHTISNLSVPLFNTITSSDPDHNAAVLDVMFKDVNISTNGNAGVIANTATGYTRIYNCGILPDAADGTTTSSISGTANVGGLVGELSGTARVINCFSYADITGGSYRGGIVGNNNVTTASQNVTNGVNTMIMNCMFYGNITSGGTVIAPIYGGKKISNSGASSIKGLNNYNYFRFNKDYVANGLVIDYNCALGAQDRFLVRFEFFRNILNSNRELAMWYVSGSVADAANEMGRWVLDKSIAPYPILKEPGQVYPSLINPDAANAIPIDPDNEHRNEGRKLGELTVKITAPSAWTNKPEGADLKNSSYATSGFTLNITDKDEANYNFNYKKIQLPYYNEVGTNNYTGNKVVTGWKITGFDQEGSVALTTGTDVVFDGAGNIVSTPYNFVDRACTDKDQYSATNKRVFNQGAYYEVPDGVAEITIEPYWANCVYLSDPTYDVTFNGDAPLNGSTGVPVTVMGNRPTNSFNNDANQTVYTSFSAAHTALSSDAGATVYDYAIVLVGNYHQSFGGSTDQITNFLSNGSEPFTVMSADLDGDNEPDNTFFYQHTGRKRIAPVRFDFINIADLGLAQKEDGSDNNFQVGIFHPKGWFEITNTVLIHFGQFEYADGENKSINAPLILQGGIYEQIVSSRNQAAKNTTYLLVGGNVWFKNFNNGCHTGGGGSNSSGLNTPKVPINIAGGDYENFYLSGVYRPEWNGNTDNAECYIDGGRFSNEMAGAGMQVIKGNVTWLINAADIKSFFGGGINNAEGKSIEGNITTVISNSYVDEFCGGPKFGNMKPNKTVKTTATDCHFGNYFGAGYGGTAVNRVGIEDNTMKTVIDFDGWNGWVNDYYHREYQTQQQIHIPQNAYSNIDVNAISTSYEYEYMFFSGGGNKTKVCRFYINFATLSLASTNDVTSTLTGCTIDNNFYGGGKFGYVNGNAFSTLTDCTVMGDAFGSGFSAAKPTWDVMPVQGFNTGYIPHYDNIANVFNDEQVEEHGYPTKVTYTWEHVDDVTTTTGFDHNNLLIYTEEDLSQLGTVRDNATLTINGNSVVKGDVYGGGALSSSGVGTSGGKAQVNINGGTYGVVENNVATGGNIYGGGKGDVASLGEGHSDVAVTEDLVEVNIGNADQTSNNVVINGSVYGGNNINGTATNDVVVHIYKTKHNSSNMASNIGGSHAIKEVFGGGNKAHYQPTSENKKTTVHVHYCDNTIEYVYGGGNAADVGTSGTGIKSATNVIIDGGRIKWVFGGGNGYSATNNHNDPTAPNYNPGANIYGDENGNAVNVTFHAGYITYFFGGSNEWGDIIGEKSINILNDGTCTNIPENHIVELYGGNNKAPINNNVGITFTMPCSDDPCLIEYLFGGSRMANISGNVELNVRGGLYNFVFGGNNLGGEINGNVTLNLYGGTINEAAFGGNKGGLDEYGVFHDGGTITGDITVNVEDQCDPCPLQVKNIFGAGDLAVYTAPNSRSEAREFNPIVNVKHTCETNTITGNVYGGGNGDPADNTQTKGSVSGNPKVIIGDLTEGHETYRAAISGNVFGGGNAAKVEGKTTVLMQKANSLVGQDIYGGGNLADVTGSTIVDLNGGTVTQDVYGGGALAHVGSSSADHTTVTLAGATVRDIYGGGLGDEDHAAAVNGAVQVTVNSGTVRDVYGCNNFNGAPLSTVRVDINSNVGRNVYGGGNLAPSTIVPAVYINSGTVSGSVFGGGNQAGVGGGNVNMIDGTVLGSGVTGGTGGIFGGCNTSGTVGGDIVVNVTGGTIGGTNRANIHGGGYGYQTASSGNVTVNYGTQNTTHSNTPTLTGDLYGGSALGNVGASSSTTTVNVINGSITGDVYGGGLGSSDHAAAVNGNVMVYFGKVIENTLYNTAVLNTYTDGTSTLGGNVFGCNNVYGAPTGAVQVDFNGGTVTNIYGGGNLAFCEVSPIVNINNGTVSGNVFGGGLGSTAKVINGQPSVTIGTSNSSDGYKAIVMGDVYGGGDMADVKGKTTVLVQKCNTEIYGDVYGGGNAAHVLKDETDHFGTTNVTVTGGTIDNAGHTNAVYGGGHGDKDATPPVAANVATSTNVTINGGTINQVYGGSNSKGTINSGHTGGINVLVNKTSGACDLKINEVYGGGNFAASQAGSIDIECTGTGANEGITYVYGGANRADVTGPIELTIDEGRIAYVFGGNNNSGSITNGITVNIEKKAEPCVWEVGDVFGGGNLAVYDGTPVVNVKNGTVANVFGGGNGDPDDATQVPGQVAGTNVTIGDATEGYCAVVTGNVYGGGNAAKVAGNTIVTYNDGNTSSSMTKLFGGGNQAGVTGTTTVTLTNGTVNTGVYGGCNEKGNVGGNITVNVDGGTVGSQVNLNSHITGDVFGGGYGGYVNESNPGTTTSGNVEVNINNGTIWGNVYGGSAFGDVNAAGKTTTVNIMGGTLETSIEQGTTAVGLPCNIYHGGNVFGGGLGQKAATGVTEFAAKVYGAVEVNIGTGRLDDSAPGSDYNEVTEPDGSAIIKGNVYGCNNQNGSPQDNVTVNVFQTAHPEATGGYALHDVFGGGNEADFTVTGKTATVNIYTCANTIERTFSGGNAAATNSVRTMIQGGRIREVYGGGNGEVSAANVNGTVTLDIHGGEIGQSYAGSNQQGTISLGSTVNADDLGPCGGGTNVNEFFCGGNYANYIGNINATITCNGRMNVDNLYGGCNQAHVVHKGSPGDSDYEPGNITLTVYGGTYKNIYGGSKGTSTKGADVEGNIILNIHGGTITEAIFGGSNIKGAIGGTITVNVEDKVTTDECPLDVTIADVYGGGNMADYPGIPAVDSPITAPINHPDNYNYPQINIKNATVKNVFGGGLKAEVKGNPQIKIKNKAKVLGNVYGGGNMGEVDGSPKVTIDGNDNSPNPTGL